MKCVVVFIYGREGGREGLNRQPDNEGIKSTYALTEQWTIALSPIDTPSPMVMLFTSPVSTCCSVHVVHTGGKRGGGKGWVVEENFLNKQRQGKKRRQRRCNGKT